MKYGLGGSPARSTAPPPFRVVLGGGSGKGPPPLGRDTPSHLEAPPPNAPIVPRRREDADLDVVLRLSRGEDPTTAAAASDSSCDPSAAPDRADGPSRFQSQV